MTTSAHKNSTWQAYQGPLCAALEGSMRSIFADAELQVTIDARAAVP